MLTETTSRGRNRLRNLPLHDMDQNRIWCALVSLACELTAWLQMLTLAGQPARQLPLQHGEPPRDSG